MGNTTSSFEILVKKIYWKVGQFKVSGERMYYYNVSCLRVLGCAYVNGIK